MRMFGGQYLSRARIRAAFTVNELLVVIAVVGLLVSLIMPAVQSSRDRARSAHCAHNLHQIGIACQNFESTYQRFPPTDLLHNLDRIQAGEWPSPNIHPVSAQYALLPFLDQGDLYRQFDFNGDRWVMGTDPPTTSKNQSLLLSVRISVFSCVSDQVAAGDTSYLISDGTSAGGYTTDLTTPSNTVFLGFGSNSGTSAAQIVDGLSNTAAFAERLVGDKDPSRFTPARDWPYVGGVNLPMRPDDFVALCSRPMLRNQPHVSFCSSPWLFGGLGSTTYNHMLPPNSRIPDCSYHVPYGVGAYSARSLHPGGVFVLMADGGGRFISEQIDLIVWRALGTINGSESVGGL